MIVAVAGLSRCGTTLMMNMLHKGGMEVYCDNKVSYETRKIMALPGDSSWMSECEGKAVKLLDPHRNSPSKDHKYFVIWMRRDFNQQSKSQAKLNTILSGMPMVTRIGVRMVASILRRETDQCIRMFNEQYQSEIHIINFEDLIYNPVDTALKVSDALKIHNIKLDPIGMANQVIDRNSDCYDGLLETKFLNRDE